MKKRKLSKDEGQGSGSKADAGLFRMSSCGQSLKDALQKFVDEGNITADLAEKMLIQFDKSMAEALSTKPTYKAMIRGHLHKVGQFHDHYTFYVENATFYIWDPKLQRTHPGESVIFEEPVGMVKIVAVKSSTLPTSERSS